LPEDSLLLRMEVRTLGLEMQLDSPKAKIYRIRREMKNKTYRLKILELLSFILTSSLQTYFSDRKMINISASKLSRYVIFLYPDTSPVIDTLTSMTACRLRFVTISPKQ